jgi:hypothetical protein
MPNISKQIFTNIGISTEAGITRKKLLSHNFHLNKLKESVSGLCVLAEPQAIFNRLEKREKTAA